MGNTKIVKDFNHFILTRYNLYLYSINPYNVQDQEAWMRSRVPYFKKFLKSLMNQTVNDFTLVLSMDSQTPYHYTSQVITLLNQSGINYIIQEDEKPKYYVQHAIIETPFVITSRCDSDDELLPEFVETIQSQFQGKEECLDVRGYKSDGVYLYRYERRQVGSPFVTLIEPTNRPLKTSAYKKHSEMKFHFDNRFVGSKPLFIQNCHGLNVINAIRGEEKVKKL